MITTVLNKQSKTVAVEILSPEHKKGTITYIMFGSETKYNDVKKRGYGLHARGKMVYKLSSLN